ncbi:MAG: hypothetical protein IH905_08405 [Proteobacteria bacterium]|nr:hypothetical protein [Pseudomonadota bacterium]
MPESGTSVRDLVACRVAQPTPRSPGGARLTIPVEADHVKILERTFAPRFGIARCAL